MKWWRRKKNADSVVTPGQPDDAPVNPRLELLDGTTVKLEARYMGDDEDGTHQWRLFPASMADFERMQNLRRPDGGSLKLDKLPARTAVEVALTIPED